MIRQGGFTLLELMIAILLFAMISTAAYKLFESVSYAQAVTDGILDRLDAIQRAEVIIEKDFFQIIDRPVRNESGDRVDAVKAPASGYLVEFTRSGWRNPLNIHRSNLQRVAYNLEGDELVRYYWVMLDRAQNPVRMRQRVLSGVQSIKIRFRDEKKQWISSWPPNLAKKSPEKSRASVMPSAVEISIMHDEFGSMLTVVPLITYKQGKEKRPDKASDGTSQSGGQERVKPGVGSDFGNEDDE